MLVDGVDLVEGSKIKEVIIREEKRGTGFPANPTLGDKYFLTSSFDDGTTVFDPGMYEYTSRGWISPNPESSLTPYDVAGTCFGAPTAESNVIQCVMVRKVNFVLNFKGSKATADVAPAASTSFDIQKNGVSVGTITFGAGETKGSFSSSSVVTFYPEDVFTVWAPSNVDGTISDIMFTFAGNSA